LNKIRAQSPCGLDPRETPLTGFCKLRTYLGDGFDPDAPVSIVTILDSNGLDDALWCLRAVEGHDKELRLLAVRFARDVQHLMTDPRSLAALDVAERFANGEATEAELAAARDAAKATADAAWDARAAAWAAAAAAWAARDAADAARDAADAARDAADAAWAAADAAWDAAWDAAAAAWDAADAARDAQEKHLRELCATISPPQKGLFPLSQLLIN
jgi:hypothetical protein